MNSMTTICSYNRQTIAIGMFLNHIANFSVADTRFYYKILEDFESHQDLKSCHGQLGHNSTCLRASYLYCMRANYQLIITQKSD